MKKTLMYFTEIIELYEIVNPRGSSMTEKEYQDRIYEIKRKYIQFADTRLSSICDEMKELRQIKGRMLEMEGTKTQLCSLQFLLISVHKFFRFFFICFYYYLMPFFIVIFQCVLLYSNELYTNYLKKKASAAALD